MATKLCTRSESYSSVSELRDELGAIADRHEKVLGRDRSLHYVVMSLILTPLMFFVTVWFAVHETETLVREAYHVEALRTVLRDARARSRVLQAVGQEVSADNGKLAGLSGRLETLP